MFVKKVVNCGLNNGNKVCVRTSIWSPKLWKVKISLYYKPLKIQESQLILCFHFNYYLWWDLVTLGEAVSFEWVVNFGINVHRYIKTLNFMAQSTKLFKSDWSRAAIIFPSCALKDYLSSFCGSSMWAQQNIANLIIVTNARKSQFTILWSA